MELLTGLADCGRSLLGDTGVFYMHLDWRGSALARLACDQVFGEKAFMNEIIWAYETGGRAQRHFSRKHDTILMYAAGKHPRFDLTRVPIGRHGNRQNHLRRTMDEQGRPCRTIRSGGKLYRYYDDEPVYPTDVWTDVPHLQQRDPARATAATKAGSSASMPCRTRGHTLRPRRSMAGITPPCRIRGSKGKSRQLNGRSSRRQRPGQISSVPWAQGTSR